MSAAEQLATHYEGTDNARVRALLDAHPEILETLAEAHTRIVRAFGPGVVVRLEPPYFDDDVLFARIVQHGLDQRANDVFEAEVAPWLDALPPERAAALVVGVGFGP